MAPVNVPPPSSDDATLAVSSLVIVLAVVSVALRFYTRIFTRSGLKSDDWCILAAVIATLFTAALLLWGNSVPVWVSKNTSPDYIYTASDVFYLKLAFATAVLYFTIATATKQGILLMYNRIFHVSTAFRYQLFAASGLLLAWWIACTIATLTNCIPLQWSWNSRADARYCFDYNVFWMVAGAFEIALDVLILALPVSVVVRMRLSLKQKLTVVGIFLLGGFIIITGVVRVVLGYQRGIRVPSYSNTELWTAVHAGMSIVCASLPIFRPLLKRIGRWPVFERALDWLPIRLKKVNTPSGGTEDGPVDGCARPPEQGRDDILQVPVIPIVPPAVSLTTEWAEFLESRQNVGPSYPG